MSANLAYWTIAQTCEVVPLAIGDPGTGKSVQAKAFAKALNRPYYVLMGSLREPYEIAGIPHICKATMPVKDPMSGRMIDVYLGLVAPGWAMDLHDGRDWVLHIEELTCCAPAVQCAFLAVLNERRVGDLPIPDNTITLATCNPPNQAANGQQLEPPMANRVAHLPWVPDYKAWTNGMLSGTFPPPDYTLLPDDWRKHVPSQTSKIAAFLHHKPDLRTKYPENRTEASGPWPSLRSWHRAGVAAASLKAIDANPSEIGLAVEGCVGSSAALQFKTWQDSLDLPDPEEMLTEAIASRKSGKAMKYNHPRRGDQAMAMLGAVVDRVLNFSTPRNAVERWEAGITIVEEACAKEIELCVVARPMLVASAIPKGADLPSAFISRLYPIMKSIGAIQ